MIKAVFQFSFIFSLIVCSLPAVQYVPMDPTSVISVNLSCRNHNRIGIIGDRIKKAFFKGTNISVDVEEESGQLFVQAARPNCPNTTISVVSASGSVQELELCFAECSSEIILMQPIANALDQNSDMQSIGSCVSLNTMENSSLTDLVESIIKGTVPEGYVSIEDPDSPQVLRDGLKIQRLSRLVSDQQIVFIYRLHNISSKQKTVTECQVNILDGDWVFLDRYKLRPNECGLVLIGCVR